MGPITSHRRGMCARPTDCMGRHVNLPRLALSCTDVVLPSPIRCPAWTYTTWLTCTADLAEIGRPSLHSDLMHAPCGSLCDRVNARFVSEHPIAVASLHVQLTAWGRHVVLGDWGCPAETLSCADVVLHRRCPALAHTMRCLDLYDLAHLHEHLE